VYIELEVEVDRFLQDLNLPGVDDEHRFVALLAMCSEQLIKEAEPKSAVNNLELHLIDKCRCIIQALIKTHSYTIACCKIRIILDY
jgi:hypothetical protein